jgi:hypothetical protein
VRSDSQSCSSVFFTTKLRHIVAPFLSQIVSESARYLFVYWTSNLWALRWRRFGLAVAEAKLNVNPAHEAPLLFPPFFLYSVATGGVYETQELLHDEQLDSS